MKKTISTWVTAALLASTGVAVFAAPSQAPEQAQHERGPHQRGQHDGSRDKQFSPAEREAFFNKHLEREASQLQINASQQPAWEAYAAAKKDLFTTFGESRKPRGEAPVDAATAAREHADNASRIAQKLSVVADATAKLQATLNENQRKVLNRISHEHRGFGRGEHGHHRGDRGNWGHGRSDDARDPAKAPAKGPAAKASPAQ